MKVINLRVDTDRTQRMEMFPGQQEIPPTELMM